MRAIMSRFKVGDEVYCKAFGKGVVAHVLGEHVGPFPLICLFDSKRKKRSFTEDGNYSRVPDPDSQLQHVTKLLEYLVETEERLCQ